jgi:hypothetical protein
VYNGGTWRGGDVTVTFIYTFGTNSRNDQLQATTALAPGGCVAVQKGRRFGVERNPLTLQGIEGPFLDKPACPLLTAPTTQ